MKGHYNYRPGHHLPDSYTPPPGKKHRTPEEKNAMWVKVGWWSWWLFVAFTLGRASGMAW